MESPAAQLECFRELAMLASKLVKEEQVTGENPVGLYLKIRRKTGPMRYRSMDRPKEPHRSRKKR